MPRAWRRSSGPLFRQPELRIVLTGAGTSAYIGECLAPALTRMLRRRVDAIPTTDLVSSPQSYLSAETPTLMVSFGRSGNSPESLAAVELASAYVRQCSHLIVTCDADGALYQRGRVAPDSAVILLPAASNDRSFAMTSSFTGMLFAAALALRALPIGREHSDALGRLAQIAAHRSPAAAAEPGERPCDPRGLPRQPGAQGAGARGRAEDARAHRRPGNGRRRLAARLPSWTQNHPECRHAGGRLCRQ